MISNLEKAFEDFESKAELRGEIRGELRGELRGKLEGKSEVAKTMLEKGMEVSLIVEMTGISKGEVEKIRGLG
ncbi:transposase [Paenibacillus eucommiae]|uniref:Transposase/invertase (TIGR01784 family) n=1 Tax=Paenibacillus eucommiae TaxID=1355755 RepID=A0ABS4IRR7_9BACL|nr:transposase [Paenibacillus eucommiae]MBP1990267.1 putative transposase/invertase (TIGR01784 family) [Paenibacillus eucommiae]